VTALTQVRSAIRRAADRSAQRNGSPPHTTRDDLARWAREQLRERRVVIVSNREPYSHRNADDSIEWTRNAGGLTVALDAVAQAIGAVWVAHGSGDADREVVDTHDRVGCPPGHPRYTLRRIWLSAEDHERYYAGFSNGALWPLCHIVYVRPQFRLADWQRYVDVNRRFADAVLEEVGDGPALVLLQDYHLAMAARFLREARPDLTLALFWHIPWPNAEVIRRLPWREALLDGLLANDLLGFHIRFHAQNFLGTVADSLEARVDPETMSIERGGRRTRVRTFPIGADAAELALLATGPDAARQAAGVRDRFGLGDACVGLGVDRMDYTKGIPERLEALERFYEKHPDWTARLRFIQVAVPSRIEIEEYRSVARRTRECVARINARFAEGGPPLVHLVEEHLDFRALVPLYQVADVCMVTSLHDGMNLVAKEYLAACADGEGALVLSPFTGAARELEDAWIASPFDREALADALHAALTEPAEARRRRMQSLRAAVYQRTVFDWAKDLLGDAMTTPTLPAEVRSPASPPPRRRRTTRTMEGRA
jgi:trehalose 6-phosphate synthase